MQLRSIKAWLQGWRWAAFHMLLPHAALVAQLYGSCMAHVVFCLPARP